MLAGHCTRNDCALAPTTAKAQTKRIGDQNLDCFFIAVQPPSSHSRTHYGAAPIDLVNLSVQLEAQGLHGNIGSVYGRAPCSATPDLSGQHYSHFVRALCGGAKTNVKFCNASRITILFRPAAPWKCPRDCKLWIVLLSLRF